MGNLCSSEGSGPPGSAPRAAGGQDRNLGHSQQPDVLPE